MTVYIPAGLEQIGDGEPDTAVLVGARHKCVCLKHAQSLAELAFRVSFEIFATDRQRREQAGQRNSCSSLNSIVSTGSTDTENSVPDAPFSQSGS